MNRNKLRNRINKIFAYISIVVAGLLSFNSSFSQPSIVAKFVSRMQPYSGGTLPYRLFVPENYDPVIKYPLVLALHGSGERGSDNLIQIQQNRLATAWADPLNQENYPCFVVAPQCPYSSNWSGTGEIEAANSIIDSLLIEYSIDINRLYATGLSMGGYGTWYLITQYPERFAAAVPMSGGGNVSLVSKIIDLPVWTFHGQIDPLVPASSSQDLMTAFEQLGCTVIYTHCHSGDCSGLSDSAVLYYIQNHAQLLYTEYPNEGHDIWNKSYNNPMLFQWVFEKSRKDTTTLTITSPERFASLKGTARISWNSAQPENLCEIRFSPDAALSWKLIHSSSNTGYYDWNTVDENDCVFGLIKVFLKTPQGIILNSAQSSYFSINNAMNGAPFVKIDKSQFTVNSVFTDDSLVLSLLIGDPETDSLNIQVLSSSDSGSSFVTFLQMPVFQDTAAQLFSINLPDLPNSRYSAVKLEISDGINHYSDQTPVFIKENQRSQGPAIRHIQGSADAEIESHLIDPARLTGHTYQLTIQDSVEGEKQYSIRDITLDRLMLSDVKIGNHAAEGPLFDGIRLQIQDYDPPRVNEESSRWSAGASSLTVTIQLPEFEFNSALIRGYPYPADYRITFYADIVDSSFSYMDAPVEPMKFTVWNVTETRKSEVIFIDYDNDHSISQMDELYILEELKPDSLVITWGLFFQGSASVINPQPGDIFDLVINKPLTRDDVFEFGELTHSAENPVFSPPAKNQLFQNIPNPFNSNTEIYFEVIRSSRVKLEIYNMLGESVQTIVDQYYLPGRHKIIWDGIDRSGQRVASGIYFYSMKIDNSRLTKKLVLLR